MAWCLIKEGIWLYGV